MAGTEELLALCPIESYVEDIAGVALEERNGELWGLSPFTNERTPSFSIRPAQQVFYDFSSGLSGNVIDFIRAYNKCSIREAFLKVKTYIGYDEQNENQTTELNATRVCKKFSKKKKQLALTQSTVLSPDYMARFEKDPDKLEVWIQEGINREILDKYQVRFDRFENRLVYPIRDVSGNIINVSGRTLEKNYKEKKVRKYTYYFHFGSVATIYALWENRETCIQKKEIILFEGAKSVFIADTWGIQNCGAVLTSHISEAQMVILAKLGCRVVLALDKGVDVRQDKRLGTLSHYVNVEYVQDDKNLLEEKMSPVDAGLEVWNILYERRRRY